MSPANDSLNRCGWGDVSDLMLRYHNEEWGVPVHDDRALFEMLILQGAQAGLSWDTILNKRDNYRRAFDGFDYEKIARYRESDIERLMGDPGIVRNRLKIEATIVNAGALLKLREEFGTFDAYIWRFVGGRPKRNSFRHLRELPARTPESDAMSQDLKRRGFNFVGPTICYAFMQSVGMGNDHEMTCFRYNAV